MIPDSRADKEEGDVKEENQLSVEPPQQTIEAKAKIGDQNQDTQVVSQKILLKTSLMTLDQK